MTDVETFLWPGELVKGPEHRAEIVRQRGEEHVAVCPVCRCMFYRRDKAETCYGCWYSGYLAGAEENYRETFFAISVATGARDCWMDQTGGMCLALHVELDDGHYAWLTDEADALSPEPSEDDGWTIGVYAKDEDADAYGEPLQIFEGGEECHASSQAKTPTTAAHLVATALLALEAHKERRGEAQ